MPAKDRAQRLIAAAALLRDKVGRLQFKPPVAHVYNPLDYAWKAHELYLKKFGRNAKRVVFLGMNPGPFGMVQTGVPFGEVSAVRDWLGLKCSIAGPEMYHPKRPVSGFDCARSEVSGARLWGLFAARFGACENFFREHFVVNYCPLAFVEESGRNRTPDKLPEHERESLFAWCDQHLRSVLDVLEPEFVVGVGEFAAKRAELVCAGRAVRISRVLHPSPASPAANRDWAGMATRQLIECGIWKPD
ncbi:MAG TPA: uracil-DNA glycosylase family protein [Verrucomicrobiae bacterium]|nr:uracil-DNA glycosylase family protein [Verrucomicrobiae bacterium]